MHQVGSRYHFGAASGPNLSPRSAQNLIPSYSYSNAQYQSPDLLEDLDRASSSSESPDSLYSDHSPFFQNQQAFEYDDPNQEQQEDIVDIEEIDEDEHESRSSGSPGGWASAGSPGWARWPEEAHVESGWTPELKDDGIGSYRKASIISISPRGSINNGVRRQSATGLDSSKSARESDGRKLSLPRSVPRSSLSTSSNIEVSNPERRGSDPSLLGFSLANPRRRSSLLAQSLINSATGVAMDRRRSSAVSNGSNFIDPIEDARLRSFAGMDILARRFSECVEIMPRSEDESVDDDGEGIDDDHTAIARATMSTWSPYSTDTDYSEIHTAPYVPTPQMEVPMRSLLSNYPLASIAREQPQGTPSNAVSDSENEDEQGSPLARPPRRMGYSAPTPAAQGRRTGADAPGLFTPPPPAQPSALLREMKTRARPDFRRAQTDFTFPPRSTGVPPGAADPRPMFTRSTSNPTLDPHSPFSKMLQERAAGSFPLARSIPLGTSRLRESTRRRSSAGTSTGTGAGNASRRSSITDERRASVQSQQQRKGSKVSFDDESPRRSSFGMPRDSGRRMSFSIDSRRASGTSRKSSLGTQSLRKMSVDPSGRRVSTSSRKSSVMSISEYGYLAPQIVIAPSTPDEVSTETIPAEPQHSLAQIETVGQAKNETQSQIEVARGDSAELPTPRVIRRNAPAQISLPTYSFPSTPSPISTPTGNSRSFHPLDTFLGRVTPLNSPAATHPSHSYYPRTPTSEVPSQSPETPRASAFPRSASGSGGVMDRGRPITSPEFANSFPFISQTQTSPKSRNAPKTLSQAPIPVSISSSASAATSPIPRSLSPKAVLGDNIPVVAQETPVSRPHTPSARKAVPVLSSPDLRVENELEYVLRQSKVQPPGSQDSIKKREQQRRRGATADVLPQVIPPLVRMTPKPEPLANSLYPGSRAFAFASASHTASAGHQRTGSADFSASISTPTQNANMVRPQPRRMTTAPVMPKLLQSEDIDVQVQLRAKRDREARRRQEAYAQLVKGKAKEVYSPSAGSAGGSRRTPSISFKEPTREREQPTSPSSAAHISFRRLFTRGHGRGQSESTGESSHSYLHQHQLQPQQSRRPMSLDGGATGMIPPRSA